MPSEPAWVPWEGDAYAKHFYGREITVYTLPKPAGASTTYRNDYPEPPLYWKHPPPPDRSHRPTPAFGHTTSYRADYPEHKGGFGAATIRAYPEPKFKPKLSAFTTARKDFMTPPLPPPRAQTVHPAFKASAVPMGTTTMRADYLEWTMPSQFARPDQAEPMPSKFYGNTTTRSDFHWPAEMPPPPQPPENPAHAVPNFEGTTEYRSAYELVPLPGGLPADIGLQVSTKPYSVGGVGGQFHLMIKQGAPSPCSAMKTFTTVVDKQQSAAIVIVAKRPENMNGVILGHFLVDALIPEKFGVPKVEVTLKLVNEKTLQASAYYKNGRTRKALVFQVKKGPPLRNVASASEIPE